MKVILAQPRGFCAGVIRAIEIVERALKKYGPPVYVRHEIVHNGHVVESLKAKGACFVERLDEIPHGARTIFSAHGVARSVEDEAAALGLPVLDATCPLVSKVHSQGERYVQQGRSIVLIGHAGHPEVEATIGRIPGPIHLVQSEADVENLDLAPDISIAYVSQTTLSVDETRSIIAALKRRFTGHCRAGNKRHLLRDTKPAKRGTRAQQACRRPAGRRRQEQFELDTVARNRHRSKHPSLSHRGPE